MSPLRIAILASFSLTACGDDGPAVVPGDTRPDADSSSSTTDPGDGGDDPDGTAPSSTTGGSEGSSTTTGEPDPTAVTSADAESSTGDDEPFEALACPAVVTESAYCLMFDQFEERKVIVGADTGTVCPFGALPMWSGLPPVGIAWIDDTAIFCHPNTHTVSRMNLDDGTVEPAPRDCGQATAIDGRLFLSPNYDDDPTSTVPYVIYESFDDIVDGVTPTVLNVHPFASRFAGANDTLYAAWHATDHLELYHLDDGAPLPSVVLEGYDGTVSGLSVAGPSVFVWDDEVLREFDAVTGLFVDELALSPGFAGLACRPGL